jgi:hypothetical protein
MALQDLPGSRTALQDQDIVISSGNLHIYDLVLFKHPDRDPQAAKSGCFASKNQLPENPLRRRDFRTPQ